MAEAAVIPGGRFGPGAGMLMYVPAVAERLGATVHRHEWSDPPVEVFEPGIETWVTDQVGPFLDGIGGSPLLVGKSLGTNAAALAAQRGLPAIWLTPLLTVPWVVDALAAATAPFLLVGGTADRLWDGEAAERLSPHVMEVDGANHGMFVPGPVTDSITVLAQIVAAVEEFLDAIDWPQ
jgi:pimeloyl-ACP methyl ester carboxylesterase